MTYFNLNLRQIALKILFFFVIFTNILIGQQATADSMIIRINGHDHKVKDIFSEKVKEAYNNNKSEIISAIKDEIEANQPNVNSIDISLPTDLVVQYSFDTVNKIDTLAAFMNDIHVNFNYQECRFDTRFDLYIYYTTELLTDSAKLKLNLAPLANHVEDFYSEGSQRKWYDIWGWIKCGVYNWLANNFGKIEHRIERKITTALVDTAITFTDFADLTNGQTVAPSEITALENSFPLNGSLTADLNNGLVIEVNFLQGENNSYVGILPDNVNNNKLDIGGFSFLYHNLQNGFQWQNNWGVYQKINAAFDKMALYGITGCRVEAKWDNIQRSAEVKLGKTPDQVTENDIHSLMNNNATEWQVLDYILDKADEKGIIVFMVVGMGHQERPPGTPSAPNANMAPDNSGSFYTENGNYVAVTADDYLYNLKLYAHAVVRKYADRIGVWQIENELNAARYAESFNWWRKGNLWREDQIGGFQDKVWNILVNTVRTEDPRSKIIHDFHMFSIEDRVKRWGGDCDIIGVNFYPNQLFAYPVFDFAVGEYVWAVRRMLKGLNMSDKPVWVTETGYPGKTTATSPDPYSIDVDVKHFSDDRQSAYLENSLQSAIDNGAKGYFYFSLTNEENDGNAQTPTLNRNIRYSGLIRGNASNTEKTGLYNFGVKYNAVYPGMGHVKLSNLYDNQDIGNRLSLKGERDFLNSGASTWLVKEIEHTARTELEKTSYNGEIIKHHDWNGNSQDFKIDNLFAQYTDLAERKAIFKQLNNSITVRSNLMAINFTTAVDIQFKDPWLVDTDGIQHNVYRTYASPFTPGAEAFSWYDGLFLDESYNNIGATFYTVNSANDVINTTEHGEQVTWKFNYWWGTHVQIKSPDATTTAVNFTAPNAVAEARYKGHLASNTSAATGPNGSRVVARSRIKYDGYLYGSGKKYIYFMAYADGGEIWYSKAETDDQTTNGNFNWLNETKVSDGQGGNYNPSVATLGNIVYFTWAQKIGSTWYLRFRYRNNNNNSYYWSPTQTIASFTSSSTPTPQIALTENPVRVMVASNINGYVKTWLRKNGSWQYAGLNVSGSQPAICADEVYPDLDTATHYFGDIALVYTYNNDIYLRNWNTSNESWSSAKKVSVQNMFSLGNQHASVSYWDGEAYISWRALNDEIGSNSIYERSWYPNAFSSQSTVIEDPDDSFEPSVSKNSSLIVAYRNGGTVYKAKKAGSSWSRTTIGAGRYPSITPHYNETLVYNKYNSAPYLIKHHYEVSTGGGTPPPGAKISQSAAATDSMVTLLASRRLVYRFGDAALSVDLSNMHFSGQDLSWRADNHSDTLQAVSSGELTIDVSALQKNALAADMPNETLFNIYFVSGSEETLLRSFRLSDLKPSATGQREGGTRHLLLASKRSRDGYFRIGFGGNSPEQFTVLHAATDIQPMAKATEAVNSELSLPQSYSLGQNYPNPFNPVTHIRFALPESGEVTLTVYDMTGRTVSTLVNGYKTAGRYDVTFDGSGLASGEYIYRLEAGRNFVETKKLLLVK